MRKAVCGEIGRVLRTNSQNVVLENAKGTEIYFDAGTVQLAEQAVTAFEGQQVAVVIVEPTSLTTEFMIPLDPNYMQVA